MTMGRIKFSFTTALSGVDEKDGTHDQAAHEALVAQLRGYLMSREHPLAGGAILDVRIGRLDGWVDYMVTATAPYVMADTIRKAVRWAAALPPDEGFFPLRGKSKVAVDFITHIPQRTSSWSITALLPTYLYARPMTDAEDTQLQSEIARQLLSTIDGARGPVVAVDAVTLTVDSTIIETLEARSLIEKVLMGHAAQAAKDPHHPYFPFLAQRPLEITWLLEPIFQ